MNRARLSILAVGLVLAGLSAAGCAEKEKQQILALQNQYNDLSIQNKALRGQLAQANGLHGELTSMLETKDVELAAAGARLKAAEEKLLSTGRLDQSQGQARGWERGLSADKITIGSDILFSSGRASLTAAGKRALDKITNDLKTTYAGLGVRVYGYTDNDPIKKTKKLWQDNLDLSANRAMAVTRHLISKGIKAENIETIGMGATHFLAPNTTKAVKAKNRRVEIIVMK